MTFDDLRITLNDEEAEAVRFLMPENNYAQKEPALAVHAHAENEARLWIKRALRIYREHREAIAAPLKEL